MYGDGALHVELGSLDEVLGLHAALREDPPCGLVDAVPAARTLLVAFDRGRTSPAGIAAEIRGRRVAALSADSGPEVEVPVRYDGADLPEVARLTGATLRDVVRRHLSRTYVVALIGFAPGFYFMAGGDERLRVARRSSPRARVHAGAIGLAGEFTGIYPRTGPGGWQLIGHTPAALWEPGRTPSALLAPGTHVRFVEAAP